MDPYAKRLENGDKCVKLIAWLIIKNSADLLWLLIRKQKKYENVVLSY